MKKISLYALLSMLCMFMASCDEDFDNWAQPQSWPQEDAVTIPGFSASATGSTISLKDVEGDSVKVFSLVSPDSTLQVSNVRIELLASDAAEGTKAVTFNADNNGKICKADFAKMVEDIYGKRPTERTFNGQVYANVMTNGQAMLVNAGMINVVVIPEAPIIEKNYYLCGDICGWDTNASLKFNHSGKDVYEDPVFTLVFDVTKADSYWKILIADENGTPGWAGQIGVAENGDASFTGKLIQKIGNAPDPGAGRIEKPGKYIMTINMMDYTYEIKPLVADYYYLVGALQGWNAGAEGKTCLFYPVSATEITYTTKWEGDGNFKFWVSGDFGNWDKAMGGETDMSREMTGKIVSTGAGAVAVPEQNMYYTITIDLAAMTYEWTKCENQNPTSYDKMGLIGDFNSWSSDHEMKLASPHNWCTEITLADNTGLKVRANGAWDVNWGGEDGLDITKNNYFDTKSGGANISVPAGTYEVYFNDITGKIVFLKK